MTWNEDLHSRLEAINDRLIALERALGGDRFDESAAALPYRFSSVIPGLSPRGESSPQSFAADEVIER